MIRAISLLACGYYMLLCINKVFIIIMVRARPRSQFLSSYRPLGQAKRDTGLGWSRAILTIENNQAVCRVELCRAT